MTQTCALVLYWSYPFKPKKQGYPLSLSVFPLFTEYSSQLRQYISFEHYLLRGQMHFERNYQELWRNHVGTKRWRCLR